MDSFGGTPLTSLAFPNGYTAQNGLFNFYLYALNIGVGLSAGHNARNLQRQINLVDDLSVQKGTHALKFGFDFRRLAPVTSPPAYRQEAFFLDMSAATSGNSDFGFVFSNEAVSLAFRSLSAFMQDTWRVRPRLTLTYGLRWDLDAAPSSTRGSPDSCTHRVQPDRFFTFGNSPLRNAAF
jgi:outer membrane receptor protein involved in Fe transport